MGGISLCLQFNNSIRWLSTLVGLSRLLDSIPKGIPHRIIIQIIEGVSIRCFNRSDLFTFHRRPTLFGRNRNSPSPTIPTEHRDSIDSIGVNYSSKRPFSTSTAITVLSFICRYNSHLACIVVLSVLSSFYWTDDERTNS